MPAPGLTSREQDGELHFALPASPYLGEQDPSRWSDGWLHTRDAGTVDPRTGLVRVLGRRDSQVSAGGLKVDLTEVEQLPRTATGKLVRSQAALRESADHDR
jgi:acyl-CoA synthetase (AMP-forming)/AMP-acid ligase II